jgi:hypothetical protein
MVDDVERSIGDDLRAAAGEASREPGEPRPLPGEDGRPTIGEYLRSWDLELASHVLKAYPRVAAAIENDELSGVITRGIAKFRAYGRTRPRSPFAGKLHFLRGDEFADMLTLDDEIQDQEREGQMPEHEPPKQNHAEIVEKLRQSIVSVRE